MSSLRLTTSLQQKMVLTPQLRQRIEMLQMTSMELNELIEQEMCANPVRAEVMPGDEVQEISESILDQNASGTENGLENGSSELLESPSAAMPGETDYVEPLSADGALLNGNQEAMREGESDDDTHGEQADAFDEIDF